MNVQNTLYIEMTNALHKWLNNYHNDEADYQAFKQKVKDYKEFMKEEDTRTSAWDVAYGKSKGSE